MRDREHIDHSKPLVYEYQNLTTGDVMVYNNWADTRITQQLSDPKHQTRIIARNVRIEE